MASSGLPTCTMHTGAHAGWLCSSCGQNLCPDCATEDFTHGAGIVRCVHCGGLAETVMLPVDEKPYWSMYPRFLQSIFTGRGIGMLVLVGFFLASVYFTVYVPVLGPWLYLFFFYGIFASYLFRVIREAASGGVEMPGMSFDGQDGLAEMFMAVVRLILAAAPVWVPILIYVHTQFPFTHSMGWTVFLLQEPLALWSDPVLAVLIIFGFVYLPAALTVAAMTDSVGAAINPLVSLGIILRAPGHYLGVVLIAAAHYFASSFLAETLARALFTHCFGSLLKLIGMLWVVQSVTLFLPIMTGFVLGRFIFQNRKILGFEAGRPAMQPALPGARPQAAMPAPQEASQLPSRDTAPVVALDLETPPEQVLANALRSGNRNLAITSWRDLVASGTRLDLEPATGLALSTLLEEAGDVKAAARIAHAAANKDLQGPHAPMAIFTAARLLSGIVGSRDAGKKLFAYLVEKYPEHELAGIAREKLD